MKARLFLLLVLTGCASGGSFDWPAKNPFESYQNSTLESYPTAGLKKLDLVFSANVFGETEPCGCASGPKGGLDRRLNYLHLTPAFGDRLVMDAGNALFATESLDPTRKEYLLKRARAILEASQLMGMQALNVGYLDLSAGAEFLRAQAKKLKTPFVSASLVAPTAAQGDWFKSYVDVEVSNLNVRITGLTAGRKDMPEGYKVIDQEAALKNILAKGEKTDLLVIMSDLGRYNDEALLARDFGVPTVIIGSRDLSSLDRPIVRGNEMLVQPQFRGQQWGRLRMLVDPKLKAWFNLGEAAQFYKLWAQIKSDNDDYMKRQSGSERTAELRNQAAAANELWSQGPGKPGEKRSVFAYELVDMGAKYVKTNELTKRMKEVNDPN